MRRIVALVTLSVLGLGVNGVPAAGAVSMQSQASGGQSALQIAHDPLSCVVTELAPTVDARVAPVPQFERGYVYFKASGTEDFYYTPMKGQADSLEGVLPRPLPETKAIDYKVRARDVVSLTKETREYVPPVVPGSACKAKGTVVGSEGAGLTIGLTKEGQSPVPPGFNKKDIAFVILVSGATVSLAAALSGAGGSGAGAGGATAAKAGGEGKGALIAGGVAVAAGAAIAIANANKSDNTATPLPTSTPTPTATPTVTPTPTVAFAFVEADVTWSGLGDVEVQILNAGGASVGTVLPAGCESAAQRTERVLLQGPPAGTYRVMLSAKTCGAGTPASIAVVVSVQSSGQPKCANTFVNVPIGGSVMGCTFTIP